MQNNCKLKCSKLVDFCVYYLVMISDIFSKGSIFITVLVANMWLDCDFTGDKKLIANLTFCRPFVNIAIFCGRGRQLLPILSL